MTMLLFIVKTCYVEVLLRHICKDDMLGVHIFTTLSLLHILYVIRKKETVHVSIILQHHI